MRGKAVPGLNLVQYYRSSFLLLRYSTTRAIACFTLKIRRKKETTRHQPEVFNETDFLQGRLGQTRRWAARKRISGKRLVRPRHFMKAWNYFFDDRSSMKSKQSHVVPTEV